MHVDAILGRKRLTDAVLHNMSIRRSAPGNILTYAFEFAVALTVSEASSGYDE